MKNAVVKGQLTRAAADAPADARCPDCGEAVELRNRQGTYFWRHVRLVRADCSPEEKPPVWRRAPAR
jgi:hypothetical protein